MTNDELKQQFESQVSEAAERFEFEPENSLDGIECYWHPDCVYMNIRVYLKGPKPVGGALNDNFLKFIKDVFPAEVLHPIGYKLVDCNVVAGGRYWRPYYWFQFSRLNIRSAYGE